MQTDRMLPAARRKTHVHAREEGRGVRLAVRDGVEQVRGGGHEGRAVWVSRCVCCETGEGVVVVASIRIRMRARVLGGGGEGRSSHVPYTSSTTRPKRHAPVDVLSPVEKPLRRVRLVHFQDRPALRLLHCVCVCVSWRSGLPDPPPPPHTHTLPTCSDVPPYHTPSIALPSIPTSINAAAFPVLMAVNLFTTTPSITGASAAHAAGAAPPKNRGDCDCA